MQIRPTAFTIGLIIYSFIALFAVYTEFGIDSPESKMTAFRLYSYSLISSSRFTSSIKFLPILLSSLFFFMIYPIFIVL